MVGRAWKVQNDIASFADRAAPKKRTWPLHFPPLSLGAVPCAASGTIGGPDHDKEVMCHHIAVPTPPPSARIDPTHLSHHPGPLPGHRMPSPLSPAPEFPTRGLFSIPIPCSLVMCPQRDIWPPQVAAPAPRIPAMQPRPLMTAGASPPLLVCLSLSCPAGTTRPTRASRRRRGAMAETTPPPSQSLAARAR